MVRKIIDNILGKQSPGISAQEFDNIKSQIRNAKTKDELLYIYETQLYDVASGAQPSLANESKNKKLLSYLNQRMKQVR